MKMKRDQHRFFTFYDQKPDLTSKIPRGVFNLRRSRVTDEDIPVTIEVAVPSEVLFATDFGLALFFSGDPSLKQNEREGRVLDMGFGCGVYPIVLEKLGFRQVVAVDLNEVALEVAENNLRINKCNPRKVKLLTSDLFAKVEGKFDLIITNTSHLPEPPGVALGTGIDLALLGGSDGRKMMDGVLAGFEAYLKENGRLLIVHSSLCCLSKTEHVLDESGFAHRILYTRTMPIPFLAYTGERQTAIQNELIKLQRQVGRILLHEKSFDVHILEAVRKRPGRVN